MKAPEAFLASLQIRGVRRIRKVRLKENRQRLLSVSRDEAKLNAHVCFLEAPGEVLDAIAVFLKTDRHSSARRLAVRRILAWDGIDKGLADARRATARRARNGRGPAQLPRVGPCCATPAQKQFLRTFYSHLDRVSFGGKLPESVPVRLSSRMSRRLGHIRYHAPNGERSVVELALNANLLLEGNDAQLLDTMLHEMAHVEAWLLHGHRGHGPVWKRIAGRVGCRARACAGRELKATSRGVGPVTRVPPLPLAR